MRSPSETRKEICGQKCVFPPKLSLTQKDLEKMNQFTLTSLNTVEVVHERIVRAAEAYEVQRFHQHGVRIAHFQERLLRCR